MNVIVPWLMFGGACAALIIWGFYEKAKERKNASRDSAETARKTP